MYKKKSVFVQKSLKSISIIERHQFKPKFGALSECVRIIEKLSFIGPIMARCLVPFFISARVYRITNGVPL